MTNANTIAQTLFTYPKPLQEPTTPTPTKITPKSDDDGFTLVTRGAKKHSTTTAKTIAVTRTYTSLPTGKPSVTVPQGTGKAHKKNMKRKTKKAQSA